MNRKNLGWLASGLMIGPMAANAQITTLTYEGELMTGTSTYSEGSTSIPTNPIIGTAPVVGEFTASIELSGSLSANNLQLISYGVAFTGSNGIPGFSTNISIGPAPVDLTILNGPYTCYSLGGCITLTTTDDGAITVADLGLTGSLYHAPQSGVSIGPTGDYFSYRYSGTEGGCESAYGAPNPCTVLASNTTPGEWSVATAAAPEIDPASTGSGLTLLLGGLAVLRGRRAKLTPSI